MPEVALDDPLFEQELDALDHMEMQCHQLRISLTEQLTRQAQEFVARQQEGSGDDCIYGNTCWYLEKLNYSLRRHTVPVVNNKGQFLHVTYEIDQYVMGGGLQKYLRDVVDIPMEDAKTIRYLRGRLSTS